MTLLELQRRMSEDVSRPLTADFKMQHATDDGCSVAEIAASYITPNPQLASYERLEIYNRQYWFRLIDAVCDDFPALQATVGTKSFDALVLAYLRDHPSTSWTLRNLGRSLPEWLALHPDLAGRRHRLAGDVARLEWAYVEAFDRKQMSPLSAQDLRALSGDTKLSLQPHLQLLKLNYPVDELVMAVHRATPDNDIASNAVVEQRPAARLSLPTMRRTRIYLAVHRYDSAVYYRRIDREAFLLLSAVGRRLGLAEALACAFAGSSLPLEHQTAKIQEYFAHAAELGWFCEPATDAPAIATDN